MRLENGRIRIFCVDKGLSNNYYKLNVHVLSRYEQNILEKESFATMEKITDSIHLDKEHTKTDAEFYKVTFLFLLIYLQIIPPCVSISPLSRFKSKQRQIVFCSHQSFWSSRRLKQSPQTIRF